MTFSYNHLIVVHLAFSFLAFTAAARAFATARFLSVANQQSEEIHDPNNDYAARTAAMMAVRQRGLSFCWLTFAKKYPKDPNSSLYDLNIVAQEIDSGKKIAVDTTVIIYNDPDAAPKVNHFGRFPYFGEPDSSYSKCN